jgi:hypothetical protein
MLEYSVELEQKITDAGPPTDKTIFVLALCGDGFRWHQDRLKDFVVFYFTGAYRADDPYSQIEHNYMASKKISLKTTISRFSYFQRNQGQIRPNRVNCHVRPPHDPFFYGHIGSDGFNPIGCGQQSAHLGNAA